MDRTLAELLTLLAELDAYRGEGTADARPEPDGREKFVRRRKRRRLRHLLKRAEREGVFEDLRGRARPLFRVHEDDGLARVVVTHPEPSVRIDDETVTVRAGAGERTVTLSFVPTTVDRVENNGVTTLRFR